MLIPDYLAHYKFPRSFDNKFVVIGKDTPSYEFNCIAWAFGDCSRWYWPDNNSNSFWPKTIPRANTLDNFIELFRLRKFELCDDGSFENGYIKIAIFCNSNGVTHAARQLPNGLWSSKLGPFFSVLHTIESISNGEYGDVTRFMKKECETLSI